MKYVLDDIEYNVIITKKNNKNLYIRVKEGNICVTCNYLTTKSKIKNILDLNQKSLRKMIDSVKNKEKKEKGFFYLGKCYDIIFKDDIKDVMVCDSVIYSKNLKALNKWYKDEVIRIFDERYVYIFNKFKESITSPILKIRNMKTRWGVYNRKNHTITLNSKLIEFDVSKIDYVIIHELCHIIHFNHSKEFWELVFKYCPNYKQIRKEMK